jgi:hypothetical protein
VLCATPDRQMTVFVFDVASIERRLPAALRRYRQAYAADEHSLVSLAPEDSIVGDRE